MKNLLPILLILTVFFYYVVRPGDTLWGISDEFLGAGWRYWEIVDLNSRQIMNPDLIYPGQVFVIPE
jgi:nucleoid-associated protein YgaU